MRRHHKYPLNAGSWFWNDQGFSVHKLDFQPGDSTVIGLVWTREKVKENTEHLMNIPQSEKNCWQFREGDHPSSTLACPAPNQPHDVSRTSHDINHDLIRCYDTIGDPKRQL
jgi:hypothetical protein